MLILDGNFEASLLLDTKLWDRIEAKLGAVLVSVPARDIVMFGALSQVDVRARLSELSRKFVKTSSYPVKLSIDGPRSRTLGRRKKKFGFEPIEKVPRDQLERHFYYFTV